MLSKRDVKDVIKAIVYPFAHLVNHQSAPIGGILMLHSIEKVDDEALWINERLKISPETLERMVVYGRKHGCTFVSINDVYDILKGKKKARKFIAITIDDGYRNIYENAFPVFKKLNVPFNVNLTTNMMNGKMLYWWYLLERVLWENDKVTLSTGHTYICKSKTEKEIAFANIRSVFLSMPQDDSYKVFADLLSQYNIDISFGKNLGLTWDLVNEMNQSGLVTYGNHTVSHPAYACCTPEVIENETKTAQKIISDYTGLNMEHFAFPYGSKSDAQIEQIKAMGFKTILTVVQGFLYKTSDVSKLPRLSVNEENWKRVIWKIANYC